ncbi:AGE family epimerase/isomerase, partial [Candidatus Latescibacterota bacterium]
VMFEAIRMKDKALFDDCKNNIRRNLELCWDYIFGGYGGDGHFYVFDGPGRSRQKMYNEKGMWAHTEVLIATLHILEYTGEDWARDFYERCHTYSFKTFDTPHGVWSQGVDRFGKSMRRDANLIMGTPSKRKGNFHMPRAFMLNMLCLERMIKNNRKISAFPV